MLRIKELRLERGWTQQDVADKVGCYASQVCAWEKGQKFPEKHMNQLAKAFEIETADLFEGGHS